MWLLRKLHAYAGLLTFINFAVYGVAGLSVTLPMQSGSAAPAAVYRSFSMEPNLTDRQVGERVRSQLGLSLAGPLRGGAEHDAENNLVFDFNDVNGRNRVTVLEREGRLRIETSRRSFARYLYALHTNTASDGSGDWRMRMWADYNEFAMWCLLAMVLTGFAMFLATRARSRLAQVSLAIGCGAFAALYYWTK